MSDLKEFMEAFQLVNKYEEYILIKALGVILIVFGIAHFFYSWITNVFFFPSFYLLKGVIAVIVLIILSLFTVYNYFTLKRTVIKDNTLFSSRFTHFGFSLGVLYFLTFIVDLLFFLLSFDISSLVSLLVRSHGSILLLSYIFNILYYCKDGIGVFLIYFIMKKSIKSSDFEELIFLTLTSLVTSTAIHLFLLVSIVLFTSLSLLFLIITLFYSGAFIFSGFYSIRKAYLILRTEPNFNSLQR